jgi:hypothetical protein
MAVETAAPHLVVAGHDHLSIRAQRAALKPLLTEIARQSGIEIYLQGEPELTLSIDLASTSLERGLKRLLRGIDHAFTYRVDARNQIVVERLFVYHPLNEGGLRRLPATGAALPGDSRQAARPDGSTGFTADRRPHVADGIQIHPSTPVEADPLVSMRAIDPLMQIHAAQAPHLPPGFHEKRGDSTW